jgi:carbon monoxide dehydrogenase subunit G
MEPHHEFTVPVPVDEAWRTLVDIERVAPCMPGAVVEDYDGKTVTGSVKIKVWPITVTYWGTTVFEEQDEAAHRMVLIASGRKIRGQGTARASVTGWSAGSPCVWRSGWANARTPRKRPGRPWKPTTNRSTCCARSTYRSPSGRRPRGRPPPSWWSRSRWSRSRGYDDGFEKCEAQKCEARSKG